VEVRECLRLDPLRRIHEEHGALARRQGPGDLVGEVDVPRRVDQIQLVLGAAREVGQAHGLGLDRDPPLALQVHLVQVLLAHVAVGDGMRELEQAVGEGRFPVVDVRHDAEVPDPGRVGHDLIVRARGGTGSACLSFARRAFTLPRRQAR
jgi:hypothetical protein